MKISGFSFVHNAIDSGYPIIEAIEAVRPFVDDIYVVDMQSIDTSRQVLEGLNVNIIEGEWGNRAGEILAAAHAQHIECDGDVIIHFEADEVFSSSLLGEICYQITEDNRGNFAVWRLQVEQNFQRVRWHPELVHRVFRKNSVKKQGHTTDIHQKKKIAYIPQEYGYLWDCTNCFRDNWLARINKQAELRRSEPQYLRVPLHAIDEVIMNGVQATEFLLEPQWKFKNTPLNIPDILKPLLGITDYKDSKSYRRLIR